MISSQKEKTENSSNENFDCGNNCFNNLACK